MSSACQCHVQNAFCFYCEVYSPVVAENERLVAEFIAEENLRCVLEMLADSIAVQNEGLTEALREIDTHIRGTSDPIPHIVATLKRVLPEYSEGVGGFEADA